MVPPAAVKLQQGDQREAMWCRGFEFPFFGDAHFLRENIVGDGPLSPRELLRTGDNVFWRMMGTIFGVRNYKKQHTNKWRASIPQIFPKI